MFNYRPTLVIVMAFSVQVAFTIRVFPGQEPCTSCKGKGYKEAKLWFNGYDPNRPPDKIERNRCPVCNGTGYIETAPVQNYTYVTDRGDSRSVDIGGGKTLHLVHVQAGSFMMGSAEDSPVHKVTITGDYWIGKYEVTQEQWQEIMGNNPNENISNVSGPNKPVQPASWFDAGRFCDRLTKRLKGQIPEGYAVRLPTEAQWEYAARGGNRSRGYRFSGSNIIDEVAWFGGNSNDMMHEVGQKKPNELGIYDMAGNSTEWCFDWAGKYPSGEVTDILGPSSGDRKIQRGGCIFVSPGGALSTFRTDAYPDDKYCGFRVVVDKR